MRAPPVPWPHISKPSFTVPIAKMAVMIVVAVVEKHVDILLRASWSQRHQHLIIDI